VPNIRRMYPNIFLKIMLVPLAQLMKKRIIAHCSLLIAHCSLLIAHCSLLIAHCSFPKFCQPEQKHFLPPNYFAHPNARCQMNVVTLHVSH
jgi:hypothetical protein